MFGDLRGWTARRRMIATGVAIVALGGLMLASGLVEVADGRLSSPGVWWAIPALAIGSLLIGLVIASYFRTPIGADATLCDTRWPGFGLIALFLATDARTVEPLLTGVTRPVVAAAALVLLVWALRERLASERRATASLNRASADGIDGEVCATCRPLFPRTVSPTRPILDEDHTPNASSESPPHLRKVVP
ncbi:hypothetical protein [Frigoribacterium sp. UYMn621]|jgi:hypothetical protein|uniref:hypothetical protein n=1 Tax=Frigoribacterium sp. UYMn621 TaxID=3156343 RepID=UPI00339B338C